MSTILYLKVSRPNYTHPFGQYLNMLLKKNSPEFMYDLSSDVLFLLCKMGLHHIEINFLPVKAFTGKKCRRKVTFHHKNQKLCEEFLKNVAFIK